MTSTRDQIREEAIGWTIRLRDADAGGWEAFTCWLEADPAHLAAYEAVASLDAELDAVPASPRRPIMPVRERPSAAPRRAVLGWGVAAALVAVIGFAALDRGDARYILETEPGERRSVILAEGSRIHLNGATRMVLDRDNPRFSKLERGEALFHVVHDPATTFRVEVGDAVVEDLGTVFNIVHETGVTEVEVAEGAVLFDSDEEDISLAAGGTLRRADGKIVTGRRDPTAIGTWQEGQLSYSSASIAQVAADLSRNTGLTVRASPEVSGRTFSGVIMLGPDHALLRRRVATLLDVEARPTDNGWMLTAEAR